LNQYGLPTKDFYRTEEVCRVLGISPDLYRHREAVGGYPKPQRGANERRRFTLSDVEKLLGISKRLLDQRVVRVGSVPTSGQLARG